MRLSRCGWTLLGTVTFGLAVLTSCNKIDADDLAKKIAENLKKDDKPIHPVAVGDDQPIIVAGGSMSFIAPVGYAFVADAPSKSLRYAAPASTVITSVDVLGPDDVIHPCTPCNFTIAAGEDPNIKITYDKNKKGGIDPEIVTISAPNRTDLTITSKPKDMSKAVMHTARFASHPNQHKSISQVQVGTNTVPCGNFGECSVVIHYCSTLPNQPCN